MDDEQTTLEAKARLVVLEAIIDRSHQPETFVDVGTALKEIKESKLYRVTHKSFEAYCSDKWKMSRPRAYEYIKAARTVKEIMSEISDINPPATDSVARELQGTPAEKAAAWEETNKRHGPNPTAAETREVVEERRPKAKSRRRPRDNNGALLHENEDVLAWVDRQRSKGRTRDEIFYDSKNGGRDGWPLGHKAHLGQNATNVCLAILKERRRAEKPSTPPPPPPPSRPRKSAGKRLRQIGPRPYTPLVDVSHKIVQLTSILDHIDIEREILDEDGAVARLLRDVFDDLVEHRGWVELTIQAVINRLGMDDLTVKMQKMQETSGRTEGELANMRVLYEKLRRRRDEADTLAAGGPR